MRAIFLSPHFDDVALSCGGAVAAARGDARVVTVCAAIPRGPDAPFAAEIHRLAGYSDGGAYVAARRDEDRAAMSILGAAFEWGASLDAIYRRPDAYDAARIVGDPAPGDPLAGEVADLLADLRRRFPDATLVAPLAVGDHVDHRIVHDAAIASGWPDLLLYEDFPYVLAPGALEARLAAVGPLEPVRVDVRDRVATRVAAVACYASQLPALFGDEGAMRAAIAARGDTETFWRRR